MVGERVAVTFKPGQVMEERVAMEHRGQVAADDNGEVASVTVPGGVIHTKGM